MPLIFATKSLRHRLGEQKASSAPCRLMAPLVDCYNSSCSLSSPSSASSTISSCSLAFSASSVAAAAGVCRCSLSLPRSLSRYVALTIFLLLLQANFVLAADKHNEKHTSATVDRRYELQILRRLLAAGYTYYARPLTQENGTLEVRTRISLIKIQNLWERTDVKTEALEVTMRIQLNWCDGALSWEPGSFGGVDYVIIPGDRLWIPDIQIINALDDVYALIRDRRFDFKLHSDGCIWWFPTGTIFTRCELDLSYFPFDIQRCPIVFESAMYPKEFLNLTIRYDKSAVSLKTFTESGQWDLVTAYAVPKLNYVTSSTAFSRVEITLEIRRKTLYYKINVFFPCGMLSALQILTFFLPIGSEDRISQSTTILLSVVVFQSIVVGELPRTSNSIPLLCLYIDFLTGISVVTVADAILGVYVLNNANKHGCIAKTLQCVNLLIKGGSSSDRNGAASANRRNNRRLNDGDVELLANTNAIINSNLNDNNSSSNTNNNAATAPGAGASAAQTTVTRSKAHHHGVATSGSAPNANTGLLVEGDDAFEEDSLDAVSHLGTDPSNVDLLVLAEKSSTANCNHTIVLANNYGAVPRAPPRRHFQRERERDASLTRHHGHHHYHGQSNYQQQQTPDAEASTCRSDTLRTIAVCIDNIVFLIALTSSIAIPFYMFKVLPPS